ARSTASGCSDLLATNVLDEIPDANDLDSKGVVDNSVGRTQLGVAFWLYLSGLHGPYHDLEGGAVERHGTLITAEAGVNLNEFTSELRNRLTKNGVYYGP
ncbi:hypothetical protein K503DRAFT_773234, partial [Rhizopogon vinicolor AM-OR11-026]